MMAKNRLHGVIIAMPTPLLENEDIDVKSLRRLIDYAIEEGVNGLMMAGTMGEGTALVDSQKKLLIETAVEHAAGRTPILATVSDVSTRRTLSFAKSIDKIGVDYMVCATPFYYSFPDPESIIRHIRTVADNLETPVIFYNASGRTGNPVSVDTIETLLSLDNIVGLKDSSLDYHNFAELLRRYPDKNDRPGTIMQADEFVLDASLLMGADGIVSGAGVAYIKTLLALYEAGEKGDRLNAIMRQQQFTKDFLRMMGPNPSRDWMYMIKAELVRRGILSKAHVTTPFL
jgi:4-hydroxy-tetrahydrodipicolinate synthase